METGGHTLEGFVDLKQVVGRSVVGGVVIIL